MARSRIIWKIKEIMIGMGHDKIKIQRIYVNHKPQNKLIFTYKNSNSRCIQSDRNTVKWALVYMYVCMYADKFLEGYFITQ